MKFLSFEKGNMFVRVFICVFLPLVTAYPSSKCQGYCSNDAVCVIEQDEPVCYCLPEWEGERCDLVREENFSVREEEVMERSSILSPECALAPPKMCGVGVCIFSNKTYSCACPVTHFGPRCQKASRRFYFSYLFNKKKSSAFILACIDFCGNRGLCSLNSLDEPQCNCTGTGFQGRQCTIPLSTATQPTITTIAPECAGMKDMCGHGSCIFFNGQLGCVCKPGYTGDFCDEPLSGNSSFR